MPEGANYSKAPRRRVSCHSRHSPTVRAIAIVIWYVHSANFIHRDRTIGNVALGESDSAEVVDFESTRIETPKSA
jgi:tRNA A-37 threonylcarbamoyl transferase component Bud32